MSYRDVIVTYFGSSFDEYASEVRSGRLEWSPVHKSEKFWVENNTRLNEKNYELLKYACTLHEVISHSIKAVPFGV